jgi:RNase H-like domain found in reverse transcriptase
MRKLEADCFLKLPSYDRPFHVATDYSGIGIGGVLMQENADSKLMPL